MPIACTMTLNSKEFTVLSCAGVGDFPVFSGRLSGRDNPAAQAQPMVGPLPQGRYYIVDRNYGGRLGWIRQELLQHLYGTDRSAWFALYKDDGQIDDWTYVQGVRRGNFRLHPIGPLGLSEGCITLANPVNFESLRKALLATKPISVPGFTGTAYGTVDVQ